MRTARFPKACLLPVLGLAACAPHVDLEPMPIVQSHGWSEGPGAAPPGVGAPIGGPETLGAAIGSPALDALIDKASRDNTEIAIAAARIRQARALLRVARGAMLPVISASGGIEASRTDQTQLDFRNAFGSL